MNRSIPLIVLLIFSLGGAHAQTPEASSSVGFEDPPSGPVELSVDEPERLRLDVVFSASNVTCFQEGFASVSVGVPRSPSWIEAVVDPATHVFRVPPGAHTEESPTGPFVARSNMTLVLNLGRAGQPTSASMVLEASFEGLEGSCYPAIPPASSNATIEIERPAPSGDDAGGGASAPPETGQGSSGGSNDAPLGAVAPVGTLVLAVLLRRR